MDLIKEFVLDDLLVEEVRMAHVEGHEARKAFINTVRLRLGKDKKFDALVQSQLDLLLGEYLDPRTFCAICNSSTHKIRNMLITWCIDHPEEANQG